MVSVDLKMVRTFTFFNRIITISLEKHMRKILNKKEIKQEIKERMDFMDNYLLHKNLMHLEFINFLEAHYSGKDLNKLPLDFLQSFQKIKTQAQNNTLNLLQSKAA